MYKKDQPVTILPGAGSFRETEHHVVEDQFDGDLLVRVVSDAPDDKPFYVHEKFLRRRFPALRTMVDKLDNRPKGNGGYVTYKPEIMAILSELTDLVPAVILEEKNDDYGISVMIKVGFTIGRDEI